MADVKEGGIREALSHKATRVKVGYGIIFVIFVIMAWFLRDFGEEILGKITIWKKECGAAEEDKCFGKQGVLRISMSLFLFFITMSLAMIGHKDHDPENIRTKIQDGFWIFKVLLLVVYLLVAYFLPIKVMVWYGYASMIGATFFIFIQILLLVNFAYDWNESWVHKEWFKSVIASSIIIYVIVTAGDILMYIFFGNSSSCAVNIFLISFLLVLCLTATYLSIRDDIDRGSLLTSAVVTGFVTYLLFSALLVSTDAVCNPFPPNAHSRVWILAIGVVMAIVSICYNTIASASQKGVFQLSANSEEESLIAHENDCYNFSYFHLVFACGATYMGMLFTGWNLTGTISQGQFDIGPISMWIKIASGWITVILYIWSMVAPKLFPNREWN